MKKKLLVLADAEFHPALRKACKRYSSHLIVQADARELAGSPADVISQHIQGPFAPDGILVVAPFGLRNSIEYPGPCLGSVPVGTVYADTPADLAPWLLSLQAADNPPPIFALMSMWKPFYLKWARIFGRTLREGYSSSGIKVQDWCADRVLGEELSVNLSRGVGLGIYTGHGRSRGWSGYRGLRWQHIEATTMIKPVSCLIALTCDNLKFDRQRSLPFGVQWIASGRGCAFFASVEKVQIHPLIHIASAMVRAFSQGKLSNIGEIIRETDLEIKQNPDPQVTTCWKSFRLIGNPLQRFV